jgi:hypothetical protein
MNGETTRRRFVTLLPALTLLGWPRLANAITARRHQGKHPEPRPNITAARVLTREQLAEFPDVIPVFDMVREMPQIADGIRCACGCAAIPENYSMLSCFESDGMAIHCDVCKAEAKLAHALFKQSKTLKEIRAALDAKYGS